MGVFRIRAHCLAQQYEWKQEYDNAIDLKNDIYKRFQSFPVNNDCGIIVYYDESCKYDCIFDSLDILPKGEATVFDLYVKRVWACCAICFNPFDIIPSRLPLECPVKTCNVQYCLQCIDTICQLEKNHQFTCMFCNRTTARPERNILLENRFLWQPYTLRYGGHGIDRLETIFNGPNLSDVIHRMENRRTHIQALQKTLQTSLSMIRDENFNDEITQRYLHEADLLNDKLDVFTNDLKKSQRAIISQPISYRNLVQNYRVFLRNFLSQKVFKQEAASFLLLCIKLSALENQTVEDIKTTSDQTILDQSNVGNEYQTEKFKNLAIKESSEFVDDILRDINYRREILHNKQKQITDLGFLSSNHPYESYYRDQYQSATKMLGVFNEYETKLNTFRNIYNEIDRVLFEYKDELSRKTLDEEQTNQTASLPTNEQMSTFECSRLILISELLRSETERIDMERLFPKISKLVHQWKENTNIDPKIYDLFQALEIDLLSLYDWDHPLMNQIPFRVGFIGNISVGKSSLVNYLRTKSTTSFYSNRTFSPTAVGQSTVSSLQFDENHLCSDQQTRITIRYVDVEGCTDYHTKIHAASYCEQIRKADCDLYLILLTGQQGSFECKLKREINEKFNRPCWFVRSKVDREFDELFQEHLARQKLDNPDLLMSDEEENELAEQIIERIREKTIEICQATDEQIFLVNSTYQPTEEKSKFSSKTHRFDIDLLSERLIEIAQQSFKQERVTRMATMACAHAIGTCLRRRCIVSFLKHQLRASIGAVLVPWGDQLALAHTCYEIRLALGIQDSSVLYNSMMKKVDRFQTLLLKYPLNIDAHHLRSDDFKYLNTEEIVNNHPTEDNPNECVTTIQLNREQKKEMSKRERFKASMPSGVLAYGIVGKGLAATTLAVSAIGYGIGAGLFGLSLVTAIPIGLWALKKSNKQIRDYLDDLCTDLLVISEHFIIAIINQQISKKEHVVA